MSPSREATMVRRGYLCDVGSDREDQPVDVGVWSAILDNLVHHFAADGFEGRHIDMFRLTKRHDRKPIIKPTPEILPKRLLFTVKPRIHCIKTILEPLVKHGDIRGVMLKIVIHDDNDLASGDVESRHDRIVLAEVPAQVYAGYEVVFASELDNHPPTLVGAIIVDKDQLVGVEMPTNIFSDSMRQLGQAPGAHVNRADDR